MIITLSPARRDIALSAERSGATLVLNGEAVDLGSYAEGDNDWIVGQPEFSEGLWHVTLVLPHGAEAPAETLFPAQLTIDQDGPFALPPYTTEGTQPTSP